MIKPRINATALARLHGTRSMYVKQKCRCAACREVNRVYSLVYSRTPSGQVAIQRYRMSEKYRQRVQRYLTSERGREVQRAAHQRYFQTPKGQARMQRQQMREKLRRWVLNAWKQRHGCADKSGGPCKGGLEFHHLDPNLKIYNISKMSAMSLTRLKAELRKCIILCRKHHVKYRTQNRIGLTLDKTGGGA